MSRPGHHDGGYALPPGWVRVGPGLWRYVSGATVEDTGRSWPRFLATFAEDEWKRLPTRGEAMAWVMGTDLEEGAAR